MFHLYAVLSMLAGVLFRCSLSLLVALRVFLSCDIHGDGNVHGSNVRDDAGACRPMVICT
ncbi:hypothetical protein BDV27DRAFT_134051 [Aspergillus caelatus]|uniref:Uncharacterized protein n=2 Tax=Aspergillus subgen. Circumdati TaxID=2720871 RepID=A0A5N6ZSZ1_9EURO|nr:uncharacterized protein BDV27DRAFT_134051 [Aspergillus caelatus]KAE8360722.1 hypothetical protein BDV27DRAFT_134051 [Aspergillus caelatus]KAE8416302.1 hypothetical protein BDV36DRAFT_260744 [Aspergillus pseudocaelatus]